MNVEGIRRLLKVVESCPSLKRDVAQLIIKLCQDMTDEIYLTLSEEFAGTTKGKLECVKLYKDRTGKSLIESKKDCEKYFEANGLKFFNHSY